jgi:two-component system cell cycle sensor histidine kinase/response regulator CckA
VYGVVTQNSGFLNVYSEPGQGATFKVYLPRVLESVPDAHAARAVQEPRGHGETILLVEDEPAMLEIAAETLADLGYTVLSTGTPGQALSVAQAHPGKIHLLITDVIMPGMNGRELAERLGKIRSGMRCLFVSGYTADIIARHGFLDEGVRFLQKPFSRLTLAVKVREVLDSSD